MKEKQLSKKETAEFSPDEAYEKLIRMIKEMSHDELIEFYSIIETYKAFHDDND